MPKLLTALTIIGTAAMLWVGGAIIIHGLDVLGLPWLYDTIHHIAEDITHGLETGRGFVEWMIVALGDGIFGLALGLLLIPVVTRVLSPLMGKTTH